MARDGTRLWYLTDRQGSVIDIVNDQAAATERVLYGAFGRDINVFNAMPGGLIDRYQFTGREADPDTNLQYNRARWFDPQTGRWQSQDPLDFVAGDTNLYRYAGNSPTNATDPSGEIFSWFTTAVGAAIGAAVNSVVYVGSSYLTGQDITLGGLAGAAVSGAIGGAIIGAAAGIATGDPSALAVIGLGALAGGFGSAGGSIAQQWIDNRGFGNINWGTVGIGAAAGVVGGAAGGAIFGAVGRGVVGNLLTGVGAGTAGGAFQGGLSSAVNGGDIWNGIQLGAAQGYVGGFLGGVAATPGIRLFDQAQSWWQARNANPNLNAPQREAVHLDIGGEGRYPDAINVNPNTTTSTTGTAGRPIPNLVQATGERLPFANQSADIITIQNAPIRSGTVSEIARVIRPGGDIRLVGPATPEVLAAHQRIADAVGGRVFQARIRVPWDVGEVVHTNIIVPAR